MPDEEDELLVDGLETLLDEMFVCEEIQIGISDEITLGGN